MSSPPRDPRLIRAGVGPQQTAQGEAFIRGLHTLAVLGGHWRRRGGGVLAIAFPEMNEEYAERADLIPRGRNSAPTRHGAAWRDF